MQEPEATDLEKVSVAIASASIGGRLESNGFIQGLVLSCLRQSERQEQNKDCRGRISKNSCMATPGAKDLCQEAGTTLALYTGNVSLLRKFGVPNKKKNRCWESDLERANLPQPFVSLSDPGKLKSNVTVIEQRLSEMTQNTGCDLASRLSRLLFFLSDGLIIFSYIFSRLLNSLVL
ncbi:unnamed protein product [Durusdinium trenchii]|uniref:Uncharacterized protein n=1 Tax=Durusdinium trenchii TaxID=1381693 RepID=A0ABP0JNX4_9DINO